MRRRQFLFTAAIAPLAYGRSSLTHKERVDRALKGADVDRPPFSFWHHFGLKTPERPRPGDARVSPGVSHRHRQGDERFRLSQAGGQMVRVESRSQPVPATDPRPGPDPSGTARRRLHSRNPLQPLERGAEAVLEGGSAAAEGREPDRAAGRARRHRAVGNRARPPGIPRGRVRRAARRGQRPCSGDDAGRLPQVQPALRPPHSGGSRRAPS